MNAQLVNWSCIMENDLKHFYFAVDNGGILFLNKITFDENSIDSSSINRWFYVTRRFKIYIKLTECWLCFCSGQPIYLNQIQFFPLWLSHRIYTVPIVDTISLSSDKNSIDNSLNSYSNNNRIQFYAIYTNIEDIHVYTSIDRVVEREKKKKWR